jgi:hypothetical protein
VTDQLPPADVEPMGVQLALVQGATDVEQS